MRVVLFTLTQLLFTRFTIALDQSQQQQPLTGQPTTQYLVELSPGETQWVTEDEKWALRRAGRNFIDITNTPELSYSASINSSPRTAVSYPEKLTHQARVSPLLKDLSKDRMHENLQRFSSFYTRYYKSSYGVESAAWLRDQINQTIVAAGADKHGVRVEEFPHSWGQPSLIATIPGTSHKTIVIGAHQDSINALAPMFFRAPGADDDGSGTVTILEAFHTLITDKDVMKGKAANTVEFHWYSAEEGGLLGSAAVWSSYRSLKRDVKAMFQQDMTGYIKKTLAAGAQESVGVITDFVDAGLTNFIKKIILEYCDIPYVLTKCGYACSDHASASNAGYPSAFVIESDFKYIDSNIHTSEDRIEYLSFDHMLQHAKMTVAFTYELAFAKFD
ncbi:MAG: Leucine aminopeptidase 1 [Vezdaea aestivalis]|nr:MAG: Leucine aminopeptidase 1 [Vezdaea aestivalis]